MSIVGMHVASEAGVAVACFSAAFAVLWYILNRGGLNAENRRAGYLLFACFLGCGLSRVIDLAAMIFPNFWILDYFNAFLVAASHVSGVAVWPLLPELAKLPSASDLQEANRKLAAQERARGALMDRLTDANMELERRVAQRTSELLTASKRFEAALAGSNISVAQQDSSLRYTWAYNMPGRVKSDEISGAFSREFLPDADAATLDAAKRRSMETGETLQFDFSTRIDGDLRWFEEKVEPLAGEDGFIGVISTAVDVTARKRHEIELVELLRELTHRSKNLLAVVAGIARQTGQSTTSIAEFNERFGSRLQALSLAHELLVTNAWRGVDLRMLVEGVIANVAPRRADGVAVDGPPITLAPETAQTLAIGLHEMAANAARHGGLAGPNGALTVSWKIETGAGSSSRLMFVWQERNISRIVREDGGFGFSFIGKLLPRALDGSSLIARDNDSLTWTVNFPLPVETA